MSGTGVLINPSKGIIYTTKTLVAPFLKNPWDRKLVKDTSIQVLLSDRPCDDDNLEYISAELIDVCIHIKWYIGGSYDDL